MGKPKVVNSRPKTVGDAMDILHRHGYRHDPDSKGNRNNRMAWSRNGHEIVLPTPNRQKAIGVKDSKEIFELFKSN